MAEARHPRHPRPLRRRKHVAHVLPCLLDAKVGGVDAIPEPVNDQALGPLDEGRRAVGDARAVTNVRKGPDPEAHVPEGLARLEEAAVLHGQRRDLDPAARLDGEGSRLVKGMPAELGDVAASRGHGLVDEVWKGAGDLIQRGTGAVHVDAVLDEATEGPLAQIVEAKVGVGMGVGEQQGVDAAQAVVWEPTQRRVVEGLAAVDEQVLVADAEEGAGIKPRVLGGGRGAGGTGGRGGGQAADDGHGACSGASL